MGFLVRMFCLDHPSCFVWIIYGMYPPPPKFLCWHEFNYTVESWPEYGFFISSKPGRLFLKHMSENSGWIYFILVFSNVNFFQHRPSSNTNFQQSPLPFLFPSSSFAKLRWSLKTLQNSPTLSSCLSFYILSDIIFFPAAML